MTTDVHAEKLSARQVAALPVLLVTGSDAKAAEQVGVTERTLRRWQADPAFSDALRDLARESAGQAHAHLLAAQREAVQTLRQAMRAGTPATRVRAARALLEIGLKVADDDMERRITRLEAARWEHATMRPDLRALSS